MDCQPWRTLGAMTTGGGGTGHEKTYVRHIAELSLHGVPTVFI
jgi:hypothetical protein